MYHDSVLAVLFPFSRQQQVVLSIYLVTRPRSSGERRHFESTKRLAGNDHVIGIFTSEI